MTYAHHGQPNVHLHKRTKLHTSPDAHANVRVHACSCTCTWGERGGAYSFVVKGVELAVGILLGANWVPSQPGSGFCTPDGIIAPGDPAGARPARVVPVGAPVANAPLARAQALRDREHVWTYQVHRARVARARAREPGVTIALAAGPGPRAAHRYGRRCAESLRQRPVQPQRSEAT
jgi:hypothetical protein